MNKNINEYQTLIFDCDGVVLNSNQIKTLAFYEATKHYGDSYAQALVDYHVANGGVSRYLKFEYFLEKILGQEIDNSVLDELLERFATAVKNGLMKCEIAKGLEQLREKTPNATWMIVSGGDQSELREVFQARGLDNLFDGGIFGSPDDKDMILEREKKVGNVKGNALFLGDSKYDFKAATTAELDFVFINDWSEVKGWKNWCNKNLIQTVKSLNSLNSLQIIEGVQFYISSKAYVSQEINIKNDGVNNIVILKKNSKYGSKSPILLDFVGSGNYLSCEEYVNVERGHHRFVGNGNRLTIGKETTIGNAYLLLEYSSYIDIGEDCMVSYQTEFRTTDAHSLYDTVSGSLINPPKSIKLGDHVWVGKGALIMQGVELGNNIVVGTRALVTKSFNEENIAIAGVPAKIVRKNVSWKRDAPKN